MKKLIMMMTLMMSFVYFGQTQCKYDLDKVDKFTGIVKLETKSGILHRDVNSAISFNFCKYDNDYFIKVGINLSDKIYTIIEGDKLMLICGDSIVSLTSQKTQVVSGFVYVNYSISKNELNILNELNITNLRIYLGDSYIEKIIDNKKSENIKQLSTCINK